MTNKEVLEAARVIRDYCKSYKACNRKSCIIAPLCRDWENAPSLWQLPESTDNE